MSRSEQVVQVPEKFRGGSLEVNRWLNQLREAVVRLRDRRVPERNRRRTGGAAGERLPWRISVADAGASFTITVGKGVVSAVRMVDDSNGEAVLCVDTYVESGPFTLTGAADNTTYGIWLRWTVSGGLNLADGGSVSKATEYAAYEVGVSGGALDVFKDSTYTDSSDLAALTATTALTGYAYLGKVELVSGVATVTQACDKDLTLPTHVNVYDMTIVSADANNDITQGADGGAYYDDPDY